MPNKETPLKRGAGIGLEATLKLITHDVVETLGYAGAMVTIHEQGDSLSVRALCVNPDLATDEQVREWKADFSDDCANPIGIGNPKPAGALLFQDEFQDNLSVRAFRAGVPVCSDDLYDLLTSITPSASRPIVKGIQQALGIQEIIAIPFFLDELVNDQSERGVIGNLVVATRSRVFDSGEIELLKVYGRLAAVGMQNVQLTRQFEERRRVARVLGRMAFSATASVHALRNHIGAFRMYLHLLQIAPPERVEEILASNSRITARLDEAVDILNNLHQPWSEAPDAQTDVNTCLRKVIGKTVPDREGTVTREGIIVLEEHSENLPTIRTSPYKLAAAFKALIENALDAIRAKGQGGELRIASRPGENETVQVLIHDSGNGIRPEHLAKVFEFQWSPEEEDLGFGLFWAKEYIEGLGGSIRVDSVWKEGTTFEIYLPSSREPVEHRSDEV